MLGTSEIVATLDLRYLCQKITISRQLRRMFEISLKELRQSESSMILLAHLHRIFFIDQIFPLNEAGNLPILSPTTPGGTMFQVFFFLSGVPFLEREYKMRGMPLEILTHTLGDIEFWIRDSKKRTGTWSFAEAGWLVNHFSLSLFKLGRLQFLFDTHHLPINLYKNKQTGETRYLINKVLKIRRDGFIDGSNNEFDSDSFSTSFVNNINEIVGHPISHIGEISRGTVSLDKLEWENILTTGDNVISVHIDATAPMNFAKCVDSFREARAFFSTHFESKALKAFTCCSWLMDKTFLDYLPAHSNILQFQSLWHLTPIEGGGDKQIFERVFGEEFVYNLKSNPFLPTNTSLQKAVIEHMKKGSRWCDMGGVIPF